MHRLLPLAALFIQCLTIWAIPGTAQDSPPSGRDPADIFRHFDANGDKKLSKDEFLKLAERNARLKANVELMLRRLDANKDGFLTLEEYSQLAKRQSARATIPPSPGQKATTKANGFVEIPTVEQVTFFEKKIR